MVTTRPGSTGTLAVRLAAAAPSVVLLSVRDATGRTVVRRRLRERAISLHLPAGAYVAALADEYRPDDPRRQRGVDVAVEVSAGQVVAIDPTLEPAAVVRVATARHARVLATSTAGERVASRADHRGQAVLAGLAGGAWVLTALDPRRGLVSAPVAVIARAGAAVAADVVPDVPTARLRVSVVGSDPRPVRATHVVVTDAAGRRTEAPLRDGLADVGDLAPGPLTVTVPPSVGHHGATVEVDAVAPGALGGIEVTVPIGAVVTGRVVQVARQYAAVVSLHDEDGRTIERTRTDERGRFELGRGLGARRGLTVVATTGPETLHVTRAAVADVEVCNGVRHDLGDVVLPVAGRRAVWAARSLARGTRLPSPRV